jgi:hypothetical protein
MIGVEQWKSACSPGADVRAVFFRVSMLRILQMLSGSGALISPWLHDGKPDDAVFKVVATLPNHISGKYEINLNGKHRKTTHQQTPAATVHVTGPD